MRAPSSQRLAQAGNPSFAFLAILPGGRRKVMSRQRSFLVGRVSLFSGSGAVYLA
jgi:hypothetical protein